MPRKRSLCKHAGNFHLVPSSITGSICGNANQGALPEENFTTAELTLSLQALNVRVYKSYGSHFQCRISLAGTESSRTAEPLGTVPLSARSDSCVLGLSLRRIQNFEKSLTQVSFILPKPGLTYPSRQTARTSCPPVLRGRCRHAAGTL